MGGTGVTAYCNPLACDTPAYVQRHQTVSGSPKDRTAGTDPIRKKGGHGAFVLLLAPGKRALHGELLSCWCCFAHSARRDHLSSSFYTIPYFAALMMVVAHAVLILEG